MSEMNYQVVWRGFIHDSTGYARASREYLLALDKQGVDVKVEPLTHGETDIIIKNDEQGQRIMELVRKPYAEGKKKVLVYHAQPDGLNYAQLKDKFDYIIINTVWETTAIPENWKYASSMVDAIFVPSKQNIEAFVNSGVATPMYLVPHGSDAERFNPNNEPLPITDIKDRFTFLSVFNWQHRKAPEALLRAYWEEFTPNDNVSLIVKTFFSRNKEHHKYMLSQLIDYKRSLGYGENDTAPVLLTFSEYSDENMQSLYATADAFVLPTRGEGVGLPFIEALSTGLPVIATGWGGQMDFLTNQNAFLVDYELESCISKMPEAISPTFANLFLDNMQWAEPNIESLRKEMRLAFENPELVKEKGKQGLLDMQQMSWDKAGQTMKEAIENIIRS